MARSFTVAADFKGERVFLGVKSYPRQELLTLGFSPVLHSSDEAQRIAAKAEADETLSHIQVEAVSR